MLIRRRESDLTCLRAPDQFYREHEGMCAFLLAGRARKHK